MTEFIIRILCLVIALIVQDCSSQEDEGPYRGKLIGKINSYHHQVSGEVYAVDEFTLLLVNFNYDGTGDDTFFWAGDSGRPGPQGFIIPDQHGKTNILERYYNEEVRLSLPEGKRISRLKWLAVYDIGSQNTFGDVYVPDDLEAPAPRAIGPLAGSIAVSSGPLMFLDSNTLKIPNFRYDGSGEEVYFWTGVGPQPSSKGIKIPDDFGYLEPIRAYNNEDVVLSLPGARAAADVSWVSVWDAARQLSLGAALVPDALNVPPAHYSLHPYTSTLPSCRQLHRRLQVSWEVFGNQITIQLAGQIGAMDYMAFGISGSSSESRMLGADVAVAYYDEKLLRGFATDYNISALAPCLQVLGQWQGVCRDSWVGGQDNHQVFSASRQDGLTVVTYRRILEPSEPMDLSWGSSGEGVGGTSVVWALGALDEDSEPCFHREYNKRPLHLSVHAPASSDCVPFTIGMEPVVSGWEVSTLGVSDAARSFTFSLGPGGGRSHVLAPLAWYVDGHLAPDLVLRRGLHYTFKILGGLDPHSATLYHPLVVSASPRGGLERRRTHSSALVLSGAARTRRGRLTPTHAGALCVAQHAPTADRRRDRTFSSFRAFNRTLVRRCDESPQPAELHIAPNSSWPDLLYYNSFTHADMGGRILVVDRHKRNIGKRASAATRPRLASLASSLLLLLSLLL